MKLTKKKKTKVAKKKTSKMPVAGSYVREKEINSKVFWNTK